jgi:hypothetical protein
MSTQDALLRFRDDLAAALVVADAFDGRLTPAVRSGVEEWFSDITREDVFPLAVLPLSDDERRVLVGAILTEMLSHVDAAIGAGLSDMEAFASLGELVDPLFREFRSAHAEAANDEWRKTLPQTAEDLSGRIEALKFMTGLDVDELRDRARADRRLHAMMTQIGVTLDDLD